MDFNPANIYQDKVSQKKPKNKKKNKKGGQQNIQFGANNGFANISQH